MGGQGPAAAAGREVPMHRSSRSCPRIARFAHERRQHPTVSEQKLWSRLKGSQLGVGFRREFAVGRYIADFAAPSLRVIVEVDGGYHVGLGARDARRDRALARAGWRVVRVDAALVMADLEAAVAVVTASVR